MFLQQIQSHVRMHALAHAQTMMGKNTPLADAHNQIMYYSIFWDVPLDRAGAFGYV